MMMMKQTVSSFSLILLFLLHCTNTLAQPAAAPTQAAGPVAAPLPPSPPMPIILPGPSAAGPTNVTKILEKAGRFSMFIRLLKATSVADQIEHQLNDTNSGLTIFAPSDDAFSSLSSGTLNSLTDEQKELIMQFHLLSNYIPISRFRTLSNPLRTNAGDNSRYAFPLNVTSYSNSVNISTGITNTSFSSVIYSDGQVAIYQVNKVLLPWSIFGAKPPASAPAPAPALLKPEKQNATAVDEDGDSSNDDKVKPSGAASLVTTHNLGFLGVAIVAAIFSLRFY